MTDNYISKMTEHGMIHISENVVAVLVGAAVDEVESVAGLASAGGGDLQELLGKRSSHRGVKVGFQEDDTVVIDVMVNINYGCIVADVARQVQDKVATTVADMTGSNVVVNVHVAGVAFNK